CTAGNVQCLIAAIGEANTNGQTNKIQLEGGIYTLTNVDNDTDGPNGLPSITSTLTIDVVGNKTATITRAANVLGFRLFHVGKSGHLTLQGVVLSNGLLSFPQAQGGGLFNNGGVVNIANSAFVSNGNIASGYGGGLVNNNGAVTIVNSTF